MNNNLRIIFMGTPAFAVESLASMLQAGYRPVAVVTSPDKPAGRGLKNRPSPVKLFAVENSLEVLQPCDLKDIEFLSHIREYSPDLLVVVAFRKLPAELLTIPSQGAFNLHASLLPDYRGAAPIQRALMNGEKETGVTTFMLNEQIDEGHIIFRETVAIGEDQDAGSLHDALMHAGAELVVKTIHAIENGNAPVIPQSEFIRQDTIIKKAPKIFREDCRINWSMNTNDIFNLIRALSPSPGAFTTLLAPDGGQHVIKILSAGIEVRRDSLTAGNLETDGISSLKIAAGNGFIAVKQLQLSGKKALNTPEFLRGFKISNAWKACFDIDEKPPTPLF